MILNYAGNNRLDRELIDSTRKSVRIPGVSAAYIDAKTITPSTITMGRTDRRDISIVTEVQPDTVFGVASLNKPVFAYLVLTLIDKGVLNDSNGKAIGSDTALDDSFSLNTFFASMAEI